MAADALTSAGGAAGHMRCPVCRAAQAWAQTCRRCRADLSLLTALAGRRERLHAEALRALHEGNVIQAFRRAQQVHRIQPDAASRRLLLACRMAGAVGGDSSPGAIAEVS